MPCWEVNTLSVKFSGKSVDLLKAIGARQVRDGVWAVDGVEIDLVEGKATGRKQSAINSVKRRYSEAAVKKAARVNRWTVVKRSKATRKFQAIKY